MHSHKLSCHGGVGMTMAKFRQKYWSPRLRSIVKLVTKNCHTFKRFRAIAVPCPPIGNLPRDRTEGNTAFQVVGVDYAGPIKYLKNGKTFVAAAKWLREIMKDERLHARLAGATRDKMAV